MPQCQDHEIEQLAALHERPVVKAEPSGGTSVPSAGTRRPPGDPVDHPAHYTMHPSGVECIQITEHMNFCRGNAVKYIWRAGIKGSAKEDLRKAVWYLQRDIARLDALSGPPAAAYVAEEAAKACDPVRAAPRGHGISSAIRHGR